MRISMLKHGSRRPVGAGVAGLALSAAPIVPAAFATASPPGLLGSATAGKPIFVANCAACHTLRAAGADGQIGPDLVRLSLPEATIVTQVTNGGPALMGNAAAGYRTTMVGYKRVLSPAQIDDVAAFVYTAQHPQRG
jgi:cytochrome c6